MNTYSRVRVCRAIPQTVCLQCSHLHTYTLVSALTLLTQHNHHVPEWDEEPEPEWMEFGPTDRFDVIELKGFDKEELEREGI